MNAAEVMMDYLDTAGVDTIFGGGTYLRYWLLEHPRIKTITVTNEQGAAYMACGYAMFSNKLGVCFASAGPGELNLLNGLSVALSDSLPVLSIGGYAPKRFCGKGGLNEASGRVRTPDARRMFAAATKRTFFVEHPNDTCEVLDRAIHTALAGRPGPVHVHLPYDVMGGEVERHRPLELNVEPVVESDEKIAEFADVLVRAKQAGEPVMALFGYGATRSGAEDELLEFIERFQIPFAATMDGKGILPETHPLSLGGVGTAGDPSARAYFAGAKVVVAMGNSFAQHATYLFKPDLFEGKTLMHINIDPAEIGKVYQPDHALVSDVKPAVRSLIAHMSERLRDVARVEIVQDKLFDREVRYEGDRIHPAELCKSISELSPPRSIILGDAGEHLIWLNEYLKLDDGKKYQNPGSFGPMAVSVNAAIGIKCAEPDRPVICGAGDGSYLMGGFELLTAVEHRIPIVWIIFNNAGYGIHRSYFRKNLGPYDHTDFRNPDYVKLANACGATGHRIEKIDEFPEVFKKALASNEPTLIEAVLDPELTPPLESLL